MKSVKHWKYTFIYRAKWFGESTFQLHTICRTILNIKLYCTNKHIKRNLGRL